MILDQMGHAFNRSLKHTFVLKKLCFTSVVLALCGLLVVFCRGLSIDAGSWISLSLAFIPLFLCAGLLFATGVVLIRLYHNEVKAKKQSIVQVIGASWDLVMGTSYLALLFILCYLALWILLGLFLLLREVPGVGFILSIVLSFAPFLLMLGSIALSLSTLLILFFTTPTVALQSKTHMKLLMTLIQRMKDQAFLNLLLLIIGVLPVVGAVCVLWLAIWMTDWSVLPVVSGSLYIVLHWFFLMLPFVALLSPAVVFFFNFAADAHMLVFKRNNA